MEDTNNFTLPPPGCLPDSPDDRDHIFVPAAKDPHDNHAPTAARLVRSTLNLVRNNPHAPPIFNQGQLGSCTANAFASGFAFVLRKQDIGNSFIPSRLFLWYNARAMSNNERKNTGVSLRNALKSLTKDGVCSEEDWKYEPYGRWDSNKNFLPDARAGQKPPARAYENALNHKVIEYISIKRNIEDLKACLDAGYPFIFAIWLDELIRQGFEEGRVSGRYPESDMYIPITSGHAVMAIGYDESDLDKCFIIQNSWGTQSGNSGHFTMAYEYFLKECYTGDFWTIRVVT